MQLLWIAKFLFYVKLIHIRDNGVLFSNVIFATHYITHHVLNKMSDSHEK